MHVKLIVLEKGDVLLSSVLVWLGLAGSCDCDSGASVSVAQVWRKCIKAECENKRGFISSLGSSVSGLLSLAAFRRGCNGAPPAWANTTWCQKWPSTT